MTVCVWQSVYDSLYMTVCVWQSVYDSLYMTVYMTVCVWQSVYDSLYMTVCIWQSVPADTISVQMEGELIFPSLNDLLIDYFFTELTHDMSMLYI